MKFKSFTLNRYSWENHIACNVEFEDDTKKVKFQLPVEMGQKILNICAQEMYKGACLVADDLKKCFDAAIKNKQLDNKKEKKNMTSM